jgi:hypothetical protein
MRVSREAIKRIPGFLFNARLVVQRTGAEETIMGSSEKKRAREQNAAARRDRAAQRRIDKAASSGNGYLEEDRDRTTEPDAEAVPADRAA